MAKNLFNSVKMFKPKKNVFDLSHDVKMTLNMGVLTPVMCLETVPGDKFNIGCESLIRFSPLVSPVMHRMDVYVHYFFVPNPILWPGWEDFITNTDPGGGVPAFPYLQVGNSNWNKGSLMDYLGIPDPEGRTTEENVSALPFAAYQKIFNEYYRGQNLVSEVNAVLTNGFNGANTALLQIRRRAWEHDYFTAALPFAQKGDAVDIPLGQGTVELDSGTTAAGRLVRADSHSPGTDDNPKTVSGEVQSGTGQPLVYDPDGTLITNLEPTTINDLRRAFRLQEWLERNARGGTRYVENILAHFGVRSSDKRLQRPEYITGVKTPVQISEVLKTAEDGATPQGNMAGHGISVVSGKYGSYFCEEHGYIIGIMSVMPKTAYQQGIARHFLKINDAFDYYWPSFAHIGEQEVQNRELYAYQAANAGDNTFGYVPHYAEYKFHPSRVAADFRSSLDFWHLGRIFASAPALNESFVECVPDSRVFAVTDPNEQKLYAHVYNKVRAVRPMPKFGTPSF